MPRPAHSTTHLPRKLRDELGLKDGYNPDSRAPGRSRGIRDRKGVNGGSGLSRKDKRRSEREEKRASRKPVVKKPSQDRSRSERGGVLKVGKGRQEDEEQEDGVQDEFDVSDDELDENVLNEDDEEDGSLDEDEDDAPRRPRVSRAVQDKLDQDDAEIARLEKALGIKNKKKLPQAFKDDGLDEIMGDLGEDSEEEADGAKKRKREGDEWLQRKRQKAKAEAVSSKGERTILSEDDEEGSDSGSAVSHDDDDSFEGFDEAEPPPKKKVKENPYVAPVPANATPTTKKYIPPSLRTASTSEDSESLFRLRRQTQGHLNKLSEANLLSIVSEIEKLYQSYPRQNVTTTLIELLLGLICNRSSLNDSFINLHAGFIAAVYKVMGMDFGAQLVQRLVEQFDAAYEEQRQEAAAGAGAGSSKEVANLVTLLSQLYNLYVIGCGLVFDYIRLFLMEITELNTELLLKIIKSSGPQLRQDDPSALKDIVLLIQPAISQAGEAGLSVRTKFMIETITDLKNNKLKASFAGLTGEQITRMRKIVGSLNNSRSIKATEPLRIGRADIHNSAKKGKWWLVGASWTNDPEIAGSENGQTVRPGDAVLPDTLDDETVDHETVDLAQLAKMHRMNTDVRRSIFVAIMSATDCRDAHVRLNKLRLKRNQTVEIPHVLIHCASEETAHNPYYTLIARKICGEKRMRMALMFALWNVFKRMGERSNLDEEDDGGNDPDDEDNVVSTRAIVNLAKMYGTLVAEGVLTLGILKVLDFLYLQPKTRTFVELLLITTILNAQQAKKKNSPADGGPDAEEKRVADVFFRTRDTPQIVPGLMHFIRKVVAKSDVVSSKREKKALKSGCRVAVDTLKVVSNGDMARNI